MKKCVEVQCNIVFGTGVLKYPIMLLTRKVQGLRIVLLFVTTVAKLIQFLSLFSVLSKTSAGYNKTGQSQISSGNQLSTINIR